MTAVTIYLTPEEEANARGAINAYCRDPHMAFQRMVLSAKTQARYDSLAQQLGMPLPGPRMGPGPVPDPGDAELLFWCDYQWFIANVEPARSRWDGLYTAAQIAHYVNDNPNSPARSVASEVAGTDGGQRITSSIWLVEQVKAWIGLASAGDPNLPWAVAYVARGGGYYDASRAYRQD